MAGEKKAVPTPIYKVYAPDDLAKKWFVYWYAHGKRQRKYGTINQHHTYAGRQAAARALIQELEEQELPATVQDQLRQYVADQHGRLRPKSYEGLSSMMRVFLREVGEAPLTGARVRSFFTELQQKRSPTTANNYRITLQTALRRLGRSDLMAGIEPIRFHKTPARYFQPHQVQELKRIIAHHEPELWHYIQWIYYCFIRPKELRLLKVGHILFEHHQVYVPAPISKNSKGQYVAIPDAFWQQVEPLQDRPPGQYLFPSCRTPTKPYGRNTMNKRHSRLIRPLGYGPEYVLYSWKHTGAVRAVQAGINLKQLQIQLRHHSLDQVDKYLRQLGVQNLTDLQKNFPSI